MPIKIFASFRRYPAAPIFSLFLQIQRERRPRKVNLSIALPK